MRDLHGEGNCFFRSGGKIETLDLSILVVNDLFAAGQEGVAWKNVTGEERFLIVARDGIFQPVVFAAFEVAQTQAGLRLVTRDVEDLLTIR